MPVFTLVGLKTFKKNEKTYYMVIVSDDDCNVSTIFVENNTFEFLKNYKYKNISQFILIKFDRQSKNYRLFIDKK